MFPISEYGVLPYASTGKTKVETIEPKIQRLLKNNFLREELKT